jgi:hypothetical protein
MPLKTRRIETMAVSKRIVRILKCLLLMAMLPAGSSFLSAQAGAPAVKAGADATTLTNEAANFKQAREVADAVLQRPEFQRELVNSWWENKKQQFGNVLGRIFAKVARVGHAVPWLAKAMEWTLFGGAALGLLLFVLRELRRQRLHVSLSSGAVKAEAWTREADDWSQRAEAFAKAEEWREAVHCLYWAAIVLLESRRAWRHNPTRTPREYVRLLRAGSLQQQGLRGLTQIFERSWYGLREVNGEQYAQARGLYEGLMTASAAVDSLQAERLVEDPLADAEGL